ncbi:preprotein translocase subunit YajC [Novipirellula galeiformis]|uniref:Sec translocon accessory complex subunit YajC n=1 Tax=Novipirellula galeiformis TaxID=2528004 RepID=A0A5C6CH56_9BACT|nr:preprotein translocase subunit YajC [Novipirellula galeiformis]TWU23077.1 preprotein translocase subunit YajC [Novipirellula galeiformis]
MFAEIYLGIACQSLDSIVSTISILAQEAPAAEELTWFQQLFNNPFLPFVILFFLAFQIFIAPERRRKAEEAKMLSTLKKNDRVVTAGGIHGTVVSTSSETNTLMLRIDDNNNTRIKVNYTAIARVTDASKEKKESNPKDSDSKTKS